MARPSSRTAYLLPVLLVASACGGGDGDMKPLSDAAVVGADAKTMGSDATAATPDAAATTIDAKVVPPDSAPPAPDAAPPPPDAVPPPPDAMPPSPDGPIVVEPDAAAEPDASVAQPDAPVVEPPDAAQPPPDDAAPDDAAPDDAAPDAGGPDGPPPQPPLGALVNVTMSSSVGVLLDDFPAADRDRIAAALIAAPDQFWIDRAKQQVRLTTLRLVYRELYYPPSQQHDSLPLTQPEQWTIDLSAAGAARVNVDNHDVVAIDYDFQTTLVTDEASPGITEPPLGAVGGIWEESFIFPVNPTLLLQRTGYACMDEDEFPPESVDAENAWEFYDDKCKMEHEGNQSCHLTFPLPDESCPNAVKLTIGRVDGTLLYTRVAWNDAVADTARSGPVTQFDAPDLDVLENGMMSLSNNRVIYKYFPPDHCAVVEECVTGTGWRRLIVFDSMDHNTGAQPIHIGEVDYAVEGLGSELIEHNVYELSECHNHYHFEYYGDFFFGNGAGTGDVHKNGFCLESTGRMSNNEWSPLHTPYSCDLQGVSAGWGDLYAAGLTCNWLDVTGIDTSAGPVSRQLTFHSNPDGFICEGTLIKDDAGDQVWEPTPFTSATGAPVDRPACDEAPGTEENDLGAVPVTLPQRGAALRLACDDDQLLGPLRNCGLAMSPTFLSCTAGQMVTVSCSGGATDKPQVVRLCETSRVLGEGVDCGFNEAAANFVVRGTTVPVSVMCPAGRDAVEVGGQLAVYSGPVWSPDGAAAVTCTIL